MIPMTPPSPARLSIPRRLLAKSPRPLLLVLACLALWRQYFRGQLFRYPGQYSDSSGMVDLVGRGFNWHLRGNYLYAVYPYLFTTRIQAGEMCQFLSSQSAPETSFWRIHPYAIALPMGWVARVAGLAPRTIVALSIAGSAAIGLTIVLWFLLRYRGGLYATASLVGLMAMFLVWPVLTQGLIGQNYFDRLYFGPAAMICVSTWMAAKEGSRSAHWFGVGAFVVTALISERTALTSGLVGSVLIVGLFGRRLRQSNAIWLMGGALMNLAWGGFWQAKLQDSPYYSGITLTSARLNLLRLLNEPAQPKFFLFLAMVVPFLFLSAFEWRVLPAALAAVTPNLLVSIGGAELSGLATHYHQMYLPFLICCSAFGFIRLVGSHPHQVKATDVETGAGSDRPDRQLDRQRIRLIAGPVVVLLVAAISFNRWNQVLPDHQFATTTTSARGSLDLYSDNERNSLAFAMNQRRSVVRTVRDLRPKSVSAPEAYAPLLAHLGLKNYAYFPLAVGSAEVVVAPFDAQGHVVAFPYGRQPWADASTEKCAESLLRDRYDLVATVADAGYSVGIFRLKSAVAGIP